MRKLILRNGYSPGDIVMMTAAVRDLHRTYPGRFQTDVRTACPELWEHNPYLTPLRDDDPAVETMACRYALINQCNQRPYHCLHALIEHLNARLRLNVKPTEYKGDIHLSDLEKSWYSQVHEWTRNDLPFWIVSAGGKYDITIKWWDAARYQAVVDHFRGKIQFVQVGQQGHYHPPLKGVIDLRGRTNLRELVRLVYHAQGVLCPVTSLMHLAAAVPVRDGRRGTRPCVVIAGGREPAHWEAYRDHQFIHTNGALACGREGGCWRDRTYPLGDGDARDQADRLCPQVVGRLPRCMDLITPAEVIRRIELYFQGGAATYLRASQRPAARRAVRAAARNDFDQQPLNLHNARLALEQFIARLPASPGGFKGRGIVICGGGARYFTNAWVGIHRLRALGCRLPIQLWYLGRAELDRPMRQLMAPLGVECVDALARRRQPPVRRLGGWPLKPYAILSSTFREVLLLDADNVPVRNPEYLFESAAYRKTGAIFWPDYGQLEKTGVIWRSCGLERPATPEFESGQILVDKARCWAALRLSLWFNEHSDFYYRHLHGDKETFHLAFCKLKQPFTLVPHPLRGLPGTMCQHDLAGRRLFQHRNTDKWDLLGRNRVIAGFWHEAECREALVQLRQCWDGRLNGYRQERSGAAKRTRKGRPVRLAAVMISCPERANLRAKTLAKLAATDWREAMVHVQVDAAAGANRQERQARTARLALEQGLELPADYLLFLEDDLDFNRHLRHNLEHWGLLQTVEITLAGLYNPGLPEAAYDVPHQAVIVEPQRVFGSQALLLSRRTVKYALRHWEEVAGMQDLKLSRLAGRLGQPLYYHAPSLVQHVGHRSEWGGGFHQARDFDRQWKRTP